MNSTKTHAWQSELMTAITDPKELLESLDLGMEWLEPAKAAARIFPLKVPRSFLARIQKGNIHDPLLRQVLPIGAELDQIEGYVTDPLAENKVNPISGLLHKYHGRVLLTWTSVCGINCRYCFRREFPYEKNNPGTEGWNEVLTYIANDPTIDEVILSGGDPLVATDASLRSFVEKLEKIPHLKRLRIHSRMPIVMPERITTELLAWLRATRLTTILAVHSNHPQEINQDVINVLQQLKQAGVVLLNQSVLLKGINDDVDTLVKLSETLFDAGVMPYYLHILDKVQGSAHFDLSRETARQLHWGIAQRLSGYLVPKLVVEQPGAPAKLPIESLELCTV